MTHLDFDPDALQQDARRAAERHDAVGLCAALDTYLRYGSVQKAATSPKTVAAYRRAVQVYVPWTVMERVDLLAVRPQQADRFVAYLGAPPPRGLNLRPASVALRVAGVRGMYRALAWAEVADNSAFARVRVAGERTPGIVLNPPYQGEIDQALPHLDPQGQLLLLLCGHTGLRIAEALALTTMDLEQGGTRVRVRGKGGKVRVVPLGARVRAALAGVSPAPDGRLFTWNTDQAAYRVGQGFTAAGLIWRGFHAARKYSASRLYAATGNLERVATHLGHASTDTTRRYVQFPEDEVADVLESL